jgi:hypothetical protein
MKLKSFFGIFIFMMIASGAFAQYTGTTRLVAKTDAGNHAGYGESEILVKCTPELSALVVDKSEIYSYAVFVNGKLAAQVVPFEDERIVVKNGSVSVEVVLYEYDRHGNWKQHSNSRRRKAALTCDADSNLHILVISENTIGMPYPLLTNINTEPLAGKAYIGIISFGPNADDLTGGSPVYLNRGGYNRILAILEKDYKKTTQQGTSLYYAVHKALANLTANELKFPKDLAAVNLLTFTDGIDNNSTSLGLQPIENQNFGGKQSSSYLVYDQSQIMTRKISGKSITAYTAGIRGNDVNDVEVFTSSLRALASNAENFHELSNFAEVNARFSEIANKLTVITTDMTFTVTTPSYPVGAKVRMTFDVPVNTTDSSAAAESKKFIQGEVSVNGGKYVLTNIVYGSGIGSTSGTAINGVLNGTEVSYIFSSFTGYNSNTDAVKQWVQSGDSHIWQINSEYGLGESIKRGVDRKSVVIYLVLDSSNSLQDNDIIAIRNAAKEFVRTVYEGK